MPNSTAVPLSRVASTSSSLSHKSQRGSVGSAFRTSSTSSTTTIPTTTSNSQSILVRNNDACHRRSMSALARSNSDTSLLKRLVNALTRKKPLDGRTETSLNRCLNLLDLTTLGVGSTLGLGLYVLAGQVASTKAGPAVVVSFAFAALASAFSALCYAEFAGRVPRAGSAYAYSYITTGEFVAFIIGWNLILEYVIGASSVTRGFSGYLGVVFEQVTAQFRPAPVAGSGTNIEKPPKSRAETSFNSSEASASVSSAETIGDVITLLSTVAGHLTVITDYTLQYFDWTSIAIVLILTVIILFGVKESTNLTFVFTATNMLVVITVVISSISSLDLHNWQLKKEELPSENCGDGGFMPFGWSGVLAGSATCFFGFIGFDTIASSAEEAQNPERNVPLSIILSLFISFIAYMAIAIVQTLLWPYYAQDNITILPYIFDKLNMPITYWIVLLGAVAGLASSQLGGIYPLPRILYSMAQDKLIYGGLAHVNRRLKLPVRATIIGSIFIALLACLLDIKDLADMVSIGTLSAYSLVSLSVLIIRYENRTDAVDDSTVLDNSTNLKRHQISIFDKEKWNSTREQPDRLTPSLLEMRLDVGGGSKNWPPRSSTNTFDTRQMPSESTSSRSKLYISFIVILAILINLLAVGLTSWTKEHDLLQDEEWSYVSTRALLTYSGVILVFALVAVLLLISRLPTSTNARHREMFMVPWVPLTPTLSILVNIFLMLNLSYLTWIRFFVWMTVGLFIYFTYGIWNSEGYLLRLDSQSNNYENNNQQQG